MPESFNHRAAFSCDITTAKCNNLKTKVANLSSRESVESQGKKSRDWRIRASKPGTVKRFYRSENVQNDWGTPSLLFNRYVGSFQRVKRLGRQVDLPPAPRIEVRNNWSYTTTPPIYMSHSVLRLNRSCQVAGLQNIPHIGWVRRLRDSRSVKRRR